jgi:hypothetical protein
MHSKSNSNSNNNTKHNNNIATACQATHEESSPCCPNL